MIDKEGFRPCKVCGKPTRKQYCIDCFEFLKNMEGDIDE